MPIVGSRGGPSVRPAAAAHLSDADVERLGQELDALRDRIIASRGQGRRVHPPRHQGPAHARARGARRAALLQAQRVHRGTAMLSVAKILENMEIGHNVLHGQWDWMRDPDIHSTTWEWDFVTPAAAWKHTHNDLHHTWTNVIGKDKDVGYSAAHVREPAVAAAQHPPTPSSTSSSHPSSSGASRSTTSSSRRQEGEVDRGGQG